MYTQCLDSGEEPYKCESQITRYLLDLEENAKLSVKLQSKALSGTALSKKEQSSQQILQHQLENMQSSTAALKRATMYLEMAMERHQALLDFYDKTDTPTEFQDAMFMDSQRQYHSVLERAKKTLLDLLQNDWVIKTILAVSFFGAVAWMGHRLWVSAAIASTALLSEAKLLTHTIDATTDLIQASSREGARWTVGAMGGAVGAANGALFSSLFPGPRGKQSASVLSLAAMGVFAGIRMLS